MNEKYNLREELLAADERLKDSLSLLGMTMLTQPAYNNSMRAVMFTSHLRQFVNLIHPHFPGVFTNGENVVGKHSSGYKKAKHDTTIYKKVVKYGDIVENPFVYTLFIFDEKKQRYDIWERKDAENLTEVFGYQNNNEIIDNLEEGDFVPKDTVVYRSTSYDDSMNYGYGQNVPIMFTTEPYTSEDACVISESFAEEMTSIEMNEVPIGINHNGFLLNLYTDGEIYKPLPDIGEFASGELAVKRTLETNQMLVDFKDSSLNRISDSDVSYYKSGQIIDIDVYCNNEDLEDNPFNEQIVKYLNSQTKYYQEIYDTCEEIMHSGYKYSKNLEYKFKRARDFLNGKAKWKDDTVFGNLLLTITVKNTIPLQIGQKLAGRSGNKSVISEIRPDDEMPYYYNDSGEKVIIKVLYNILGIINRTTAFPLYEISMNFIGKKVQQQMIKVKKKKAQEKLLFDIIHDINEKQAKEMRETYDSLTEEQQEAYLYSCMYERIYFNWEPMWETKPMFFRLLEIYDKYDFLTPYDMYINKWGREIKLLNPSFIGEMYMLKLKQTSRKGFSVRGTGSINGKGLPERSYKNKIFTERTSSTPIRFGEYETLNFAIGLLPEDINLFHLLYRTSSKGRRDLAGQLLMPDDEFEISDTYTSRVAEIFAVILKSLGLRIDFIDEDEELREYDDEKISIHEIDGIEYMCTEYQFMLVKRRKDIEKELLSKFGVVDMDELDEMVMNELKSRTFLVGPDKDEYDSVPAFQKDTVVQ